MKPYFHCSDNGKTELRIPLGTRQARLAWRIRTVSGLRENRIASEMAERALSWLADFENGDDDAPADFAVNSGKKYSEILPMLERFNKAGWIEDRTYNMWRRDLLIEIRERVDANDFEPADMEWARGILAAA